MFMFLIAVLDLQATYSNYKNTLQQIASKIGDIEQEAEEHKFVSRLSLSATLTPPAGFHAMSRIVPVYAADFQPRRNPE